MSESVITSMFGSDWESKIDYRKLREERTARLQDAMKKEGFDALMLFRTDHIRYATGHRPVYADIFYFTRNIAIVPQEGEPILFVASGDFMRTRKGMSWKPEGTVRPLPTLEDKDIADTVAKTMIAEAFSSLGISKGRVGIDGIIFHFWRSLERNFKNLTFESATDVLRKAKSAKTSEELNVMKIAAVVADEGMMAGLEALRHGTRECEVAAKVTAKFFELGAETSAVAPVIASGERLCPLHRFATDRILRPGDMVMFDLGCNFNGYYCEFARTEIVPGKKPSKRMKEVYRTVYDAQMKVIETMKPGVKSTAVNEAARKVTRDAGYGEGYQGILGHGIGTSGQEPPYVGETVGAKEKEFILEPGMVFCMEPGIFYDEPIDGEYIGCRIENTILVTKDGNEVLTKAPYSEALLG
jgi:Xaa-Pro aminopeptidase